MAQFGDHFLVSCEQSRPPGARLLLYCSEQEQATRDSPQAVATGTEESASNALGRLEFFHPECPAIFKAGAAMDFHLRLTGRICYAQAFFRLGERRVFHHGRR
jgi:hypothetical protein